MGALLLAQAFDPALPIEVTRGVVIGPARIVGQGGAFVSVAEGAGAMDLNPAAVAMRSIYNGDQYFDWDWSLDANTNLGSFDAENNRLGQAEGHELSSGAAALNFMLGRFGIGLSFSGLSLALDKQLQPGDVRKLTFSATTIAIATGVNFMNGQIVAAGQLIFGGVGLELEGIEPFHRYGLALSAGAVARPAGEPYRFGFSARTRLSWDAADDEVLPSGLSPIVTVPHTFYQPAQLVIGMSYTLGARAPNRPTSFGSAAAGEEPEPIPEDRERYAIGADLVVTEAPDFATGLEAWTRNQVQEVVNTRPAFGIRLGVETEPFQDRLQARLGCYFEPSRFFGGRGRTHITTGFDLRVFELIWQWRIGAAIDLSREYSNLILSLGWWH